MSGAVAQGQSFLGMSCQQCPVLYLDLENPGYVAQGRIRAMLGQQRVPQLRVWGTWGEVQPPQFGNPQLLRICKETQPLVIVDPFRYFHDADEDPSTAMAPVMKYLRACAVVVVPLSFSITLPRPRIVRAADHLQFEQRAIWRSCISLTRKASIITLRVDKNRHGERRDFRIKADLEARAF